MAASRPLVAAFALGALMVAGVGEVGAEPVKCHKTIVKELAKLKKQVLKRSEKCLDSQNVGKLTGPCPDAAALLKIQTTRDKAIAKIALNCPDPDRTTLGFGTSCAFESAPSAAEADCAAMTPTITSPSDLATCLACWKEAELFEFVATVYASHAVEVCGGSLDETSPVCSELDCTTPLPDQRNLGDTGENDCQKAIGKAGVKHLLKVEKILEKCGLAGGTAASCLADIEVQAAIDKSEQKLGEGIHNKCGNRDPVPSVPFCCRFGMGNACIAAATRDDCETMGGDVQDNKTCAMDNTCDPLPGMQKLTWWSSCPESDTCPGTSVTTLDNLIDCVDTTADAVVDELLCLQFPSGWPCPSDGSPSGAFVE
jgi:hypothetical protein